MIYYLQVKKQCES